MREGLLLVALLTIMSVYSLFGVIFSAERTYHCHSQPKSP